MISGVVALGVVKGVVAGMKVVVVSSVVVFSRKVTAAVGAAVVLVISEPQVWVTGCLVGWLLGG